MTLPHAYPFDYSPYKGLMQVNRHESIEYLEVEPVKAVSLEVQKRSRNSPDELVPGFARKKVYMYVF